MNVKFLDNFDAVGQKAWDALAAKAPTRSLFQSWAWQRAWWRSFGGPSQGRQLRLVVVYDGADLRVVMPLVLQEKVLKFVGDGAADRLDLIYDADRSADLLALMAPLKARSEWQYIELNSVPDSSPTWRYLKAIADEAALFPLSVRKTPLWGVLMSGHDERIRRLLHTGTLAKHATVFASRGKVSVTHAEAPDLAAVPWKDLFIQHIYRWSLRADPSVFAARAGRDLYRQLAAEPSLSRGMVFSTVHLNGRPVAFHLGFVHGDVFYACVASFDLALKRFSPDDVLWREMTAYVLKRGCREVVFLFSEEPAVKRYADRMGTARCVRVFRTRREQLVGKFLRWTARIPLASGIQALVSAAVETLSVLFHRKKIVKNIRRKFAGIESWGALYENTGDRGEMLQACHVTRPEVELLRRLRPELKDMRMLDIGVGGGRTSIYFANAVKAYSAFDHAALMVATAHAYLDDQLGIDSIFKGDARGMDFADDGAYDLILFCGDGIDEAPEEDRVRIFEEVQRVGREGALFFFSSRNLQSLTLRKAFGALDFLRRLRRRALMGFANRNFKRLRHQSSAVLFDASGGYRLPAYYVMPREQVRALKQIGFHDVRVFSSRTGLEVRDWRRWDKLIDDSVYYLCRV